MFDYAQAAVAGALAAGATYADARAMLVRRQGIGCQNGNINELDYDEHAGVGVRALIGSTWGLPRLRTGARGWKRRPDGRQRSRLRPHLGPLFAPSLRSRHG